MSGVSILEVPDRKTTLQERHYGFSTDDRRVVATVNQSSSRMNRTGKISKDKTVKSPMMTNVSLSQIPLEMQQGWGKNRLDFGPLTSNILE